MAGSWRDWGSWAAGQDEVESNCRSLVTLLFILAVLGGLTFAACCFGAVLAWWPSGG